MDEEEAENTPPVGAVEGREAALFELELGLAGK